MSRKPSLANPGARFSPPVAINPAAAVHSSSFFYLALILGACLFSAPVIADNSGRLAELRQQITKLETSINSLQQDRSEAYDRLVRIERRLNGMHRDIRNLDSQLKRAQRALRKSQQAQSRLKRNMNSQKDSVASHVRTAYLLGSQAQIKLLLNQQRVDDVSRSMAYFRYLTRARLERIEAMQASLVKQQRLADKVSRQQRDLDRLKQQKVAEKSEIDKVVRQRKQLQASLDRRLQQSDVRMRELREDERRLQRLVDRIQEVNDPPLAPATASGPFAGQKNKLKLPVRGSILARFGTRKNTGGQRWNGVFIRAEQGENVRAVYTGRVVFAGWLHGFGMLMILDHGDGYMTLYGHNRSLYKVVGDWVETGEVVASVGNTGNPPRTGLYFGVRQSGKPRNPLIWCKVSR